MLILINKKHCLKDEFCVKKRSWKWFWNEKGISHLLVVCAALIETMKRKTVQLRLETMIFESGFLIRERGGLIRYSLNVGKWTFEPVFIVLHCFWPTEKRYTCGTPGLQPLAPSCTHPRWNRAKNQELQEPKTMASWRDRKTKEMFTL